MKLNKTLTTLAVSASFGLSGQAFALGTGAGTDITNTVTLGYTVNTVEQTDLTQNATFKVDTKVDFNITNDETETVKVTPKGVNYISTYTVTSTSNDALGFNLSTADLATGTQDFLTGTVEDNIQLNASLSIFVEEGTNAGYQSGEDTAVNITGLAADDSVKVYVIVTTPIADTLVDGDIASIALTASARQSDGSAIPDHNDDAFDPITKQYVVATASLTENTAFEVGTAKFTDPDDATNSDKFTIDVTVINDPMCDAGLTSASTADYSAGNCPNNTVVNNTYKPKAIPGAMVKYTLKAKNSGSAAATAVSFVQDLADIGDADSDTSLDLVQNSLDNVSVTFTGAGNDTDNSTANVLTVDVDSFAKDDVITITFTAIVE